MTGWSVAVRYLTLVMLCTLFAAGARGAPGDLDSSFGVDPMLGPGPYGPGMFVSDHRETREYGRGLALQGDGKILFTFGGIRVQRLLAAGLPDGAFGTNGAQSLGGVVDVAVDAGDDIFAIGSVFTSPDYRYHGYIARLSDSGSGMLEMESGRSHEFQRLVIAPDGQLVIGGMLHRRSRPRLTVQRYSSGGAPDFEFGRRGKGTPTRFGTLLNAGTAAVLVDADGGVVSVGNGWDPRAITPGACDFVVTRHSAEGRSDRNFASRGGVATDVGTLDVAWDAALQADGKIVVAGTAGGWPAEDQFVVLRYLPDGRLDASFGSGGLVVTDFGGEAEAYAVAIQSDGKIVAAGEADESIALARYLDDGALDGDFGTSGLVHTELPPGNSAEALEMVIQPDGRIVVGGLACRDPAPGGGSACHYAVVARYLAE
jgi:uncharacterized delta-60 repeat protein